MLVPFLTLAVGCTKLDEAQFQLRQDFHDHITLFATAARVQNRAYEETYEAYHAMWQTQIRKATEAFNAQYYDEATDTVIVPAAQMQEFLQTRDEEIQALYRDGVTADQVRDTFASAIDDLLTTSATVAAKDAEAQKAKRDMKVLLDSVVQTLAGVAAGVGVAGL